MITELKPNQIFVFGSNLAGQHGGGAALQALQWGTVMGISKGLSGQTYAIPTLDSKLNKLPLRAIRYRLHRLADPATEHQELEFLLTKVGCGIAGFEPEEMESIMPSFPSNVTRV